jgi:sec-independent protein translocase protein TatA
MTGWTSPTHIVLLLLIALLLFGAKRLPEIGRSLGHGMREFKDTLTGDHTEERRELPSSTTMTEAESFSQEERDRLRALLDAADKHESRT